MSISVEAPYAMYIDGKWVSADSGQTFDVLNPATLEIVGEVPLGSTSETRNALSAAEQAYRRVWSELTPFQRADYLNKIGEILQENAEPIAEMITLESGKPIKEARGEVMSAAQGFTWYAAESVRIFGETVAPLKTNQKIVVERQPVGVAALITPWNFPLNILSRKVATALAAGCTVVAKPAEQTPLSAVLLWRVLEGAQLPAGVANLVMGDPRTIGDEMIRNPVAKVIGFTGSTRVGKLLMRGASERVKRVALELGGHAPFIVFDDADLDVAVNDLMANKFRNAGQTCSCVNRIFVHTHVHDMFIKKLADAMQKLKVGNGLDETTDVGPLIDEGGMKKVKHHVRDAIEKGAKVILGGREADVKGGYFYLPTLLTNVSPDMEIMQEETFGPVLPVIPFDTEQEVIRRANETHYGLYAYVYSEGLGRCMRVANQLEYGMIGINESLITSIHTPAGGFKESGLGREGGHWGLDEYLEYKYIAVRSVNKPS